MSARRLESREAIEGYISEKGFICLKQENMYEESEDVIMMTPQDVPIIIQWLQDLLKEREEWTEPES